jgi:hypothetical protein
MRRSGICRGNQSAPSEREENGSIDKKIKVGPKWLITMRTSNPSLATVYSNSWRLQLYDLIMATKDSSKATVMFNLVIEVIDFDNT